MKDRFLEHLLRRLTLIDLSEGNLPLASCGPMKTYLMLILVLLSCVLWALLHQKKSSSASSLSTGAAQGRTGESKQALAQHLSRQKETERERRVDLDARLARGATRDTEEVISRVTQAILEKTREDRRELLLGWNLGEAEIARIEEIQLEHWRMQYRDSSQDYLNRPSQIGDRSDTKRVEAYQSKVRRASDAAKQVFRMDLLAVLANPERVDQYVEHEMKLVEKAGQDARRVSDAAMGKTSDSRD